MPLDDSRMATTALSKALTALEPLVRKAEAALYMMRQRLQIGWSGDRGERFDRWHSMMHRGDHEPEDYLGFRAFEAFASFMPGFKENYKIVTESLLTDFAKMLPTAHAAPSAAQGAAALTNLYHTLEEAIDEVEAKWAAVLASSKSAFHLYESLPLAAEIRLDLQTSYQQYSGPLRHRARLVRSLRAALCLLSCNVGDTHNHYDAMHADANTYAIDTFMTLREIDVLELDLANKTRYEYNNNLAGALEEPFLKRHAREAVTLSSSIPPSEESVTSLMSHILYLHSLLLPSDWVAPAATPYVLTFDHFCVVPPPDLDATLLISWMDIAMSPEFHSTSMSSPHWSAIPEGQEAFEDVVGFNARALIRTKKAQLRKDLETADPADDDLPPYPSDDEDETVVLEIRRAPLILADSLLPPIEPADPPLRPWGEREAWYKSERMSDSRAPSIHSRSRSRSPPRRGRSAGRKRSHMRAFYPCN